MAAAYASAWRMCAALLPAMIVAAVSMAAVADGLALDYYESTCPNAEPMVRKAIAEAFRKDCTLAAGLMRIHFHDAFVDGADASILITGDGTEQTSPANSATHGFEAVDAAKAAVEAACPGVVSCADILTFATRDLIKLSDGPYIRVKGGRLDGRISEASRITGQLPAPQFKVPNNTAVFVAKGLSQQDMVVLSGAHTIGKARCVAFQERLNPVDPDLDFDLAAKLLQQCPAGNEQSKVDMDLTPSSFDNSYYRGLLQGRGVFTSDDDLARDPDTADLVKFYASKDGGRQWACKDFVDSFIKLTEVGVKTGADGEIRKVCSKVN